MQVKWEQLKTKRRKNWLNILECLKRHNWQYEPARQELGITSSYLSNTLHNMRRAGVISGRPTCGLIAEHIRSSQIRMGDYRTDIKFYDIGFQRWLLGQIPPGKEVSLLNVLLSTAYDAYLDEIEQKDAA